jgi:hypothetical protein
MSTKLLKTFAECDKPLKDDLADLSSARDLSLAALQIAADKCGVKDLTAEHIKACLESAGVAVSRQAVARSLANNRGAVSTSKNLEGVIQYKLMTKGRREIEAILGAGRIAVLRIESSQPRTARLKLGEILSGFTGLVRICDPYYGLRTLDSLDQVPRACSIKFLTSKTNENGLKLTGAISDFKKQRPNCEFRTAGKAAGIHDRYVVTPSQILIVGHGLKDIGGKESFIIKLEASLAGDLVTDTIASFDLKWNLATVL